MIEPIVDPSLRKSSITGTSTGKRKAKGGSKFGNAGTTSRRGRGRPRRAMGSEDGVTGDSSIDGQTPHVEDVYNAENSKRLRIDSPFKPHAAIQGRKETFHGSGSSTAGPSRKSSHSAAAGMDSLASVAVAHDPRRNSTNNRPPYPFGLTPFRYPCHNLDLPPLPPGNPNDPNFRPFDPRAFHEDSAASTLSSNDTTTGNMLLAIIIIILRSLIIIGVIIGRVRQSWRPMLMRLMSPYRHYYLLPNTMGWMGWGIMRGMDLIRVYRKQISLLFERVVGSYAQNNCDHTARCHMGLEYFLRTLFR
ncbi:hypothetical protein C349_06898 [Cryptococcus neoformans var. grubii Br795]|nr:hypothetical protein C350_06758 [Cryptococcus neoformans var. grubii MW-RSA36]OXG71855.1 hypothetical protein C349_06898 [Cryptococcus neoformans var. grubii Br795]OXL05058.1 hypothetical protein C348_06746 [Cryptococcus neoformans var. grubii Gb118]